MPETWLAAISRATMRFVTRRWRRHLAGVGGRRREVPLGWWANPALVGARCCVHVAGPARQPVSQEDHADEDGGEDNNQEPDEEAVSGDGLPDAQGNTDGEEQNSREQQEAPKRIE
jgi:hypothetical protein